VHVAWRRTEKQQPAGAKFRVPATDAPNVQGARDLGLEVGAGNDGEADLSSLRTAVDQDRVAVLYVMDPGPGESLGLDWVVEARKSGRVPVLIYQGVVQTDLSKVADVVLPGAAWVEKDACYTNDQGRVQAVSRAMSPPGEAVEDWQVVTSVAAALGLDFTYTTSKQVRQAAAASLAGTPGYESLGEQEFNRPVSGDHWLRASNPMERLKWNAMFQDLLPVKGHNVQMEGAPEATVIPLRLVTEEISRSSE
ncbi:MAG: molybdopterin-dependent oxidoreductase, partial [Vicinamibacterales bacterium]